MKRQAKVPTLGPSLRMAPLSSTRVLGSQPSTDDNRPRGRPWQRLRQEVLERDRYLCQCGECKANGWVTPADEVDHIVPLSMGGAPRDKSNLQAINAEHHLRKSRSESPC